MCGSWGCWTLAAFVAALTLGHFVVNVDPLDPEPLDPSFDIFAAAEAGGGMRHLLHKDALAEYLRQGYIRTDIILPLSLRQSILDHFTSLPSNRNNWQEYVNSEIKQAVNGALANLSPALSFMMALETPLVMLTNTLFGMYVDNAIYSQSVYADYTQLRLVAEYLLENGISDNIKSRYLVVKHDIFLSMTHKHNSFGMHADAPSIHEPFATADYLSFYIPLVDLNLHSGGRLKVLPETVANTRRFWQAKGPLVGIRKDLGNRSHLKLDHLSEKVAPVYYKSLEGMAETWMNPSVTAVKAVAENFIAINATAGTTIIFNNQQFHDIEPWHLETATRNIYVIRCAPLYDIPVTLKSKLHGSDANHVLIDLHEKKVLWHTGPVDVTEFPVGARVPIK